MPPTTRVLTALFCAGLLALGCQKSQPESASPEQQAQGAKAASSQPQRLRWRPGMVPTAEEAEMAFSLGKLLFEQAKFDEAEEQLKIASAGGKSDADPLLLRARNEMSAKERLANAKQALEAKDFGTAERELAAIPDDSVLRSVADSLSEKLEAAREKKSQEFEEKAIEELGKGFAPDAGGQAPDPDNSDEPADSPEEPAAAAE